ncbi:MAG: glutamate synthase subunit beta [Verrucomicrobiae bacterium]|nr:glutamate synthase subunit beta [Verrucomicrobiae bacterium]
MRNPTGFLEIERQLPADETPLARVGHWCEFHRRPSEVMLHAQAARCMDCGTPYCHVGRIINGAASGCPINNLIPEWNELVYRGLWKEALERLQKTNNFPEFTGRVCPAPCEGSCTVGLHGEPVTIKQIECEIVDRAFDQGWVKPQLPQKRTGRRVAVVGSGPAGLAAAAQLNRAGHEVTVFERADRVGGLLIYGIPNMKLDKREVLMRRLRIMEQEGVVFRPDTEVGENYPVEALREEFHAIVLAIGATKPRDLNLPGRNLKGVHFAMEFLTASTRALLAGQRNSDLVDAAGKDVVVIGGGDTGTDCVATALRQGCRTVTQLEILPKPPDARAPDNPWPEWPRVYRLDYGQEEAVAKLGADPRRYQVTAKEFLGDEAGRVRAVVAVQVRWERDAQGRWTPKHILGTEKTIPAQLVLLAMGFLGPEEQLLTQLRVKRDERGNVDAEYGRFTTNVRGVFAAGDCRRGQSLVVWAIHEGRACAREVDRYLMGHTHLPG